LSEVCNLFGIKRKLPTAFHPQTDWLTERKNQFVELFRGCFVNHLQNDCNKWLPLTEFNMNDTKTIATGFSPLEAMYGYSPSVDPQLVIKRFESSISSNTCTTNAVSSPTREAWNWSSI
jgi:hypothetical protein